MSSPRRGQNSDKGHRRHLLKSDETLFKSEVMVRHFSTHGLTGKDTCCLVVNMVTLI